MWFILMTTAGFIGGAAFNHYVAFKMLIAVLRQLQLRRSWRSCRSWTTSSSMYTRMLFIMGVVFQMPTLVFFLAKMGLVTARFLASQFKLRRPRDLHHRRGRDAERRSLQPDRFSRCR